MNCKLKLSIYSLASAFALHIIVGILLVLNINFLINVPLEAKKSQVVPSYLYREIVNVKRNTALTIQKQIKSLAKPRDNVVPKHNNSEAIVKPINKPLEKSVSSSFNSNIKEQPVENLLAILHQAIQAQQQYPANALAMQQEGRATVGFNLMPDGNVNNLHLIKSSGTLSLDAAALNAVRKASPFQQVNQYLTQAKDFQIDVVFELPDELT